ncbi:MAG: DNA recombination protein RmuC [Candidatus Symbiobacter sp.]|nr:DNA recombination protein RmuC [Candidatus Symbiobacter sp.]
MTIGWVTVIAIGMLGIGYILAAMIQRMSHRPDSDSQQVQGQVQGLEIRALEQKITFVERERDMAVADRDNIKRERDQYLYERDKLRMDKNLLDVNYAKANADFVNEKEKSDRFVTDLTTQSIKLSEKDERIAELTKIRLELDRELNKRTAELNAEQDKVKSSQESAAKWEKNYLDARGVLEQAHLTIKGLQEQRAAEQKSAEEIAAAQLALEDRFKTLSGEILNHTGKGLLEMAKKDLLAIQEQAKTELDKRNEKIDGISKEISSKIENYDKAVKELELKRVNAYAGMEQQIISFNNIANTLRAETSGLRNALRSNTTRGRWGEIVLRRIIEYSGMVEHCSFSEQVSISDEDNKLSRPDVVVHLPDGKKIVIDAKVPMIAFDNAVNASTDDDRSEYFKQHARSVQTHMKSLGGKEYWAKIKPSPEFVIMFLPLEPVFSAAMEYSPNLFDEGLQNKVFLSSPWTLIAMLKSVAYGWQQKNVMENAEEIAKLGRDLHNSLASFTGHLDKMGGNLTSAVNHYNSALGSWERNVAVKARRFTELGVGSSEKSLTELEPITQTVRLLRDGAALPLLTDEAVTE